MKRSKLSQNARSPSSSTPAYHRNGGISSPFPDSDTDTDQSGFHISPLRTRQPIFPIPCLSIDVEANRVRGNCRPNANGSINSPSSDGFLQLAIDVSDNSIGRGYLSDHLHHSLSYARRMEKKALRLSARLNQSANHSMSPCMLFTSEKSEPAKSAESVTEYRRRLVEVDDFNMHSFMSISQQTASIVERFTRLADVCPDLLNESAVNRFTIPSTRVEAGQRSHPTGLNPIFNCNNSTHEMSNEVQALALIQHPNIIRYYTSWFESDSLFTQLEFCFGDSLFHFLHPDRTLDTSEAIPHAYSPTYVFSDIGSPVQDNHVYDNSSIDSRQPNILSEKALILLISQMASALHYIHATWCMVHGDVKPSNILMQFKYPEEHVASIHDNLDTEAIKRCHTMLKSDNVNGILFKLSDFGRASRAGEDRDGEDLGDGRYLPCLNDPSPTARAAIGRDSYALGITIFQSAGGSMSASMWERIRETQTIPDLSVVPNSIRSVVKGLLQPLAQDRLMTDELIHVPLIASNICSEIKEPIRCPALVPKESDDQMIG